jgi:PLP dependent protein
MLAQSLTQIEDRIGAALHRAGRSRSSLTLIAVTKVFPAEAIVEAYHLGLRDFGENYVQEFETKHPSLATLVGARYHLIGHLQSNKARRAAEMFHSIQTVDSSKLARRLNEYATSLLPVMIEVKLSPEGAKTGADPAQLPELTDAIAACPRLQLTGLMTMPPWSDDPEQSRPYFRKLGILARQHNLQSLSMGMSHDLEVAIEEGSTHIRVGTALFGSRRKA